MTRFQIAIVAALVALPGLLPAELGAPPAVSQPLVICAADYDDGQYLVRIQVTDGVAKILGLAEMVDLAGKVIDQIPTEPDDPIPDDPTGGILSEIRAAMAERGRIDQFEMQLTALRKLIVPESATTIGGARDSLTQPLAIIIPPSDQPSWAVWFQPTIKALNLANTREEVVTVWETARQKLEA